MSETVDLRELCKDYIDKKKKEHRLFLETATIFELLSGKFEKLGVSKEGIENELRKKIVLITEMRVLINLLNNTSHQKFAQRIIEERILALLASVSKDSIPDWFLEMLKDPEKVPEFLKAEFLEKVEKIYDSVLE